MKTNDDEIDIKKVTTDNTHTFVFMYQIIQSLCLVLGGLVHFITLRKFQTKKTIDIVNNNPNCDVSSDNSENKILEKYLKRNSVTIKKKRLEKNFNSYFYAFSFNSI
jgi:hypothetical protein